MGVARLDDSSASAVLVVELGLDYEMLAVVFDDMRDKIDGSTHRRTRSACSPAEAPTSTSPATARFGVFPSPCHDGATIDTDACERGERA